ncbi:MAG: hypothetical protein M3Q58_14440 [Bacteroidota bacterium]|nr:hypothetical protein [Bacteroidota bacterium]
MDLPDISAFINHKEILRDTLAGINKDFVCIGEEEVMPEQAVPTFEGLLDAIHPILDNLYHNKYQLFLALMYKVDISEATLDNAKEKSRVDLVKEIAVLIVKRELQKAVSRNFYKNQQ